MVAPTTYQRITTYCNPPQPDAADLLEWNKLSWGTGANPDLNVKFGLFQWDMTCFRSICAHLEETDELCALISSREIDGVAFGMNWNVKTLTFPLAQNYIVVLP